MISFEPIARVQSPYKQRFAIPRQANLVPEARGRVVFAAAYSDPNMFRCLEQFSHLWLLYVFDASADQGWSATVQPPRLGGKARVGVFASRSPFRPNPIGLSVVENLGWESSDAGLVLHVGGLDLLHDTPLLDIKPYLPYADCIAQASGGYAEAAPAGDIPVRFSDSARSQLAAIENETADFERLIRTVLGQDPRPAWRVKDDDEKQYGVTLQDWNIKWRHDAEGIEVLEILPLAEDSD